MICVTLQSNGKLPEGHFETEASVGCSLALARLTRKEAAGIMGVTEPDLSKQISDNWPKHHLSFQRLVRLPPVFWFHLMQELARHFGFRVEDARLRRVSCERCAAIQRMFTEEQPKQRKSGVA
jgi:hypothetical protein